MNGLFPYMGFILGWLDRQGDFTAILTGFGLFFLGIYIWRICISNRRKKQKESETKPAEDVQSVDFKNPYSEKEVAPEKTDPIDQSFDRMLSMAKQPPTRAFRVYVPHSNSSDENEPTPPEDANRVYIWE